MHHRAAHNQPFEWGFESVATYADPFNDVVLDVLVTDPDGREVRVPTFWAGDQSWRVRFAAAKLGVHRWRTDCSDRSNPDLHGREGTLEVVPYTGANPLYVHGPLRASTSGRWLEHADGTPFLWLADTWWLGLSDRLDWPGGFQTLTADRADKGFTVVQLVAGLMPEGHDRQFFNNGLQAWEPEWARVVPSFFDLMDLRIEALVRAGITPCIFGSWGWYIRWTGVERLKQHWRHLIARYGAFPVVWCLCGELTRPSDLVDDDVTRTDTRESYLLRTRGEWSQVMAYLRTTDPYGRLATAHPQNASRYDLSDDLLDFDMLQTGHHDRIHLPRTVKEVTSAYARVPAMPVIDSEVAYEGIQGVNGADIQRLMFWVCMLSGACGHTYGANGVMQMNTSDSIWTHAPGQMAHIGTPWEEAYKLPGSRQVGMAKRLLERYRWWAFEPHPEWVDPHWSEADYYVAYAAGIPRQVRVIYATHVARRLTVKGLEPGVAYHAYYVSPLDDKEYPAGEVTPNAEGDWQPAIAPYYQDWVLILECDGARVER